MQVLTWFVRAVALFLGVLLGLMGIGTIVPIWAQYIRQLWDPDVRKQWYAPTGRNRAWHIQQWLVSGVVFTIAILFLSVYFQW